jgi:hypothetical protein
VSDRRAVSDPRAVIERHYDEPYVRDLLVRLASAPTDVHLGQFDIDPTDPKIRHFVHGIVKPEIERLGLGPVASDELNNLVFRVGSGAPAPAPPARGAFLAALGTDLDGRVAILASPDHWSRLTGSS